MRNSHEIHDISALRMGNFEAKEPFIFMSHFLINVLPSNQLHFVALRVRE
jgi:hypothetical protein